MTYVALENGVVTGYSQAKLKEVIHGNCILFGKIVFLWEYIKQFQNTVYICRTDN